MQLSTLLSRLTPEERTILLDRRLGPNAVALDHQALTSQLAHPASVALALGELNFGQLLLLRWLGTRPNLEAPWSDLVEALGDRLTPELRDAYLLDLRLWGLADHHPTERGGFFATYPAVIASLPATRGVRLRQQLPALTSDVLGKIAGALGLQNPPTTKDGRVELIMSNLSSPATCTWAVERLSPEARALFAWLREHDGWVAADQMNLRVPGRRTTYGMSYRSIDGFFQAPYKGDPLDPLTELVRCALVLPAMLPGSWYGPTGYAIPEEIELAYSGRTLLDSGPMQPPKLVPAQDATGTVPSPGNVLRDVVHLLGFVAAGRCEWRQDGGPYKRSLVALGKFLGRTGAEYPEMLWDLAAAAQLLRPVRRGPGGYVPAIGVDATPRELIHGLLLGWLNTGGNAFETAVMPGVAAEARARLLELLQIMPADTWVLKSSVEEWLRFRCPMIFRPDLQTYYTSSTPDLGLASLGNLLVAVGSTPDGQDAIMIPAAHQQTLLAATADLAGPPDEPGASDGSADDLLPPWDDTWIVQPDRSIVAPPNASPDALLDLWKVAQLESNQGASVFRVTAESIAAALNRGVTTDELRTMLAARSRVPLPPTVERLIEDQGKRYGRIRVGSAHTYVKVDDPALLAELRRDKRLQKLNWQDVAPGVAFVVSSDPAAVLDTLRKAGYLPVPDQDRPKKPGAQVAALAPRPRGSSSASKRGGSPGDMVLRLARTALREDRLLYLSWKDDRGRLCAGELEVIDLHGREIHANNLDDGEEVLILADDVIESELGDPLDDEDDDLDLSFLDP